MDLERAKIDLLTIKEAFDKFKVPMILAKGVLLGAIRENRILPWDGDIDLFTLASAPYVNVLRTIELIHNLGFEFWETYKTPAGKLIHWSFAPTRGNTPVGIKMLCPSKDPKFVVETGIALGKRRATITLLPAHLFDPLKEIEFLDHKFLVPNPPEEYLTKNYGGNWRTPIKDGTWKQGRTWRICLAVECKESPWPEIIREDAPARIKFLQTQKKIEKR